ncbi:MAG: insulinase family protein [Candidatus Eremiobacteraeota bacterium]|nr:insulinase family protein [Candidatus Eremiobacteraeota bacterium]
MMWRIGAALAAVLALCGAGIGPAVTMTALPGGGTGIVRPLSGAPLAAVELWFRAPSIGFEADPQPGVANLAALAIAASEPLTGTPLATVVNQTGGRFSISVYPQTVEISALVPASEAGRVLRTMTAVYFTPVLTQNGLTQAQGEVRANARLRDIASPDETLRDALFAALFGSGPDHFSPTDAANVAALKLDDLRAFATRAFRASNCTIVLTGAVDVQLARSAVEGRGEGGAPEQLLDARNALAGASPTLTRPGPVPGFGYAWPGPSIKDERAATALDFVADYLFNPDTGVVTHQLDGVDANVDAQYVTYYDPGVFYVEATGTQADGARNKIQAALEAMRKPLDAKTFDEARKQFEYHVVSDVSTPLTLADNFGWYASEGNAAYAPGADLDGGHYINSIRGLTPQLVAETVNKFLSASPATASLDTSKK